MTLQLAGIHHLTAITATAPANRNFYTGTLGMRLVKKTVNQDDTSAYHLFYADGRATPGTDLTFFDWPTGRERRGTGSIARTGLRVSGEANFAVRPDHRAERVQGRRLAGAVGAEQGGDRALGQAEADAMQHPREPVAGVQIDHLEQRCAHRDTVALRAGHFALARVRRLMSRSRGRPG